jgi:glycosyltransferase involved in cell wall biosynthesis
MFAGKPMIAAKDADDAHEFVIHDETGLVCSPHPEAIAQAVQELFDDRIKSRQLGDGGYERVEKYRWDFVMDKLSAVY